MESFTEWQKGLEKNTKDGPKLLDLDPFDQKKWQGFPTRLKLPPMGLPPREGEGPYVALGSTPL